MLGTNLSLLYLSETPHAYRVLRPPNLNLLYLSEAPHAYRVLRPPSLDISSFSTTLPYTHRLRSSSKPVCNCFSTRKYFSDK